MSKKQKSKQSQKQWVVTVVLLSFGLSVVMSVLTSLFVDSAGLLVALIALIVLISIGIITDVIGTAVTSADERPFIAMASKKINGAKQALRFFILFFCIMCASSLIVSALWFLPIPVTLTKAIVDLLLWTVNYKMQRIWVFKDSNRLKKTPRSKQK